MKTRTKIGLVDDHTLFRRCLSALITEHVEEYIITIEATNGNELMKQMSGLNQSSIPDIVILDSNMPIMDGYETANWLKKNYPTIKVIILSMNRDESAIIRMLKLGVSGYLVKTMDAPELFSALNKISENGFYYTDFISEEVVESIKQEGQTMTEFDTRLHIKSVWDSLTEKERDFVRFSCSGNRYREISLQMKVGEETLNMYRERVFKKFNINSRIALVLLAVKNKLVDIQ